MPNPVLREGQRAPAFTLPATVDGRVRLTELRGRWVVIFFYPRDHTTGCTAEAGAFRDRAADFARLGAEILGISPDPLERHEDFAASLRLPYPLLVDRDSRVAHKYGVWRRKLSAGHHYLGIVRSTFVIDPSGRVARIFDGVRVKGHVDKVLAALREALED